MKKILLPLPVLALAIASCRPPYDGDLSYTAALAGKMRLEATVGPVASSHEISDSPDGVFLPLKTGTGVDAESGFVSFTNSFGSSLWYTELNADGEYLAIKNRWQNSSYNSDPHYPVFDFKTLKAGPYIAIMSCKTDDPFNNAFDIYGADTATMQINQNLLPRATASLINTTASPRILSAQIYPDTSTTRDRVFSLIWETASSGYREMESFVYGPSTLNLPFTDINGTAAYNLTFLPSGITRCLYYRDPAAAVSYASFYSNGAWQCWRWIYNAADPPNPFQTRLTGVTKRIDALLTTGELFSTQDDVGRVYDSEGNLRADFHLGGLKFAFEAYIAGVAHVFFSQMYVIEEQIYFNVYSIKTTKLREF